ncbi:MAG: diguanylate cyclase [Acidimicrobiia bacterium]
MSGSSAHIKSGPRRVLLAADSAQDSSQFAKALEALGCQVYMSSPTKVEELEQLLDLLGPSVVVLTGSFDTDFLSVYRRIKTPPHRALLPVICTIEHEEGKLALVQAGVDAVITAPWEADEVKAAVGGILERAAIVDQHKEVDDLTGALTPAATTERVDYEVSRARRYRRQGCLSLVDLDNYDKVRDGVGELAADAGIRRFSQIVRHELRETDMLGRLQGDRFAVIMPDTDLTGAVQAMRRVLAVIGCATVDVPGGQKVTLAASAGVGSFGSDGPEAIMSRVGGAIDRAKAAGGGALFTA